jgi:gluconolactonase
MMDFRRWVKRTTPLALIGALVAGLSGCQSAQNLAPVDSSLSPSPSFEPIPQAPALPYEDIPQLPAPAPGVNPADTKSSAGSNSIPLPEPDFEPGEPDVKVAVPDTKPDDSSAGETAVGEPGEKPAATADGNTTPNPSEPTTSTKPPRLPDSVASDTEKKPIEPPFEEPTFEEEKPVVSTTEPVEQPTATTIKTETLPLSSEPEQPGESTGPLTLPPGAGEERLPVPDSIPPRLPDSLPLQTPEKDSTAEETKPLEIPSVEKTDADTLPAETTPAETTPAETTPAETKPAETKPEVLPPATTPDETKPVESKPVEAKPTKPVDNSIPFSGSGEATVPAPTRSTGNDAKTKAATEEGPDESLELPEFEEPIEKTAGSNNGRPFIELPEITPGPTQPAPADTPLRTGLALPSLDEPTKSREVASIRSPNGTLPELPETQKEDSVRGVEIASFGGTADGIVFDSEGTAFVSHRDSISKVKLDGEVTHWAKTGAPRGHAILRDGTHLICDASERAVLHLDQDGKLLRKVVTKSDGYFLRAPNDLVVDASGGFYFSDPGYARIRNAIGKVHYVAADGTVSVVAQKLAFPEGIALSADRAKLFVAESQNNRIVEFEVLSPGELGPKEVFCKLPGSESGDSDSFVDGLAVDREGWLYVAHRGMSRIEVIGPDGDWRTSFACPDTIVKNLAFSRDYSKLFVTGTDRKHRGGRLLMIDFAGSR